MSYAHDLPVYLFRFMLVGGICFMRNNLVIKDGKTLQENRNQPVNICTDQLSEDRAEKRKKYSPTITVRIIPPDKTVIMPQHKTARQLLQALGLAECDAIVARDGKLLTPDRHIWPNDSIYVRVVASSG